MFTVIEARYAIWIIHVQCQLLTIDKIPDAGVVSSLAGPDSDITCSWQPIISCQFLVACARAHTKAITYGAVGLFANERIFESGVWGKICCRGPQRVVGRIKWYLYVHGIVSDRNWS